MKHILLQDDEHIFLIYFEPNKKGKLFELLSTETRKYWENQDKIEWGLLFYLVLNVLRPNGFKCEEMFENEKIIDVYNDIDELGNFFYKQIKVNVDKMGVSFDFKNTHYTFENMATAIAEIDKIWEE